MADQYKNPNRLQRQPLSNLHEPPLHLLDVRPAILAERVAFRKLDFQQAEIELVVAVSDEHVPFRFGIHGFQLARFGDSQSVEFFLQHWPYGVSSLREAQILFVA